MACGCGKGKKVVTTFQVKYDNGAVRRYVTEAEAQRAVDLSNGKATLSKVGG